MTKTTRFHAPYLASVFEHPNHPKLFIHSAHGLDNPSLCFLQTTIDRWITNVVKPVAPAYAPSQLTVFIGVT